MRFLVIVPFLLLFWSNPARSQQCTELDWTSTFAIAGDSMSQCENNVSYVNGLRSAGYGALVETGPGVIKAARCCAVKLPYSQEGNDCYWDEWWTALSRSDFRANSFNYFDFHMASLYKSRSFVNFVTCS